MIPQTMIKPGQRVKCELTGITGVVCSIAMEENGNVRIGIQPTSQDGKLQDSLFTDECSVVVVDEGLADKSSPLQDTEFGIGQLVKDKYSGFMGHITMLVWYLNGCVQAVVTGLALERSKPVNVAFQSIRLLALEAAPELSANPTGGPITTEYARR